MIAISSLIMIGISRAIAFFYQTNRYTLRQSAAIRSGSEGIEQLTQDIREASFAEDGAYPIAAMSTTSLIIYADVNRDGLVEKVNYQLQNNNLIRAVTAPTGTPPTYTGDSATQTVSSHIRNDTADRPLFKYFDLQGDEITDFSRRKDVSLITMQLVIDVDPDQKPASSTIRSSAKLRNVNKPS